MEFLMLFPLVLLGWLTGCLINYLADVLPVSRRLTSAVCATCQRPYTWRNYVFVQKCQGCGKRRGLRFWSVILLAVTITLLHWLIPPARLGLWPGILLMAYFGLVMVIDIEHRLILHIVSAFGAVITAIIGIWMHGALPTLFGGLAGLGLMALLYLLGWGFAWVFGRLRGTPIEEDPMGFGDIMLGGVLGLILGWPGILAGIFFTILIAGAGSLLILLVQFTRRKYKPFAAVAFGPYMILAAIYLLYRP